MNCSRVKLQRIGRAIAAVAIAAMAYAAPAAHAAGAWQAGMAWPGLDGPVSNLGAYRGGVVAYGDFTLADGLAVPHLAWWKDGSWRSLGTGTSFRQTNAGPNVARMVEWRGQLILAGAFELVSGTGDTLVDLAAFDGVRWRGFDGVMARAAISPGAPGDSAQFVNAPHRDIRDVSVWHDRLLLAGDFALAPDSARIVLAAWDGTRWDALAASTPDGFLADNLAATSREVCLTGHVTDITYTTHIVSLLWDGATTRALPEFSPSARVSRPVAWHDSLWCVTTRRIDYSYFGEVCALWRARGAAWDSVAAFVSSYYVDALPVDEGLVLVGSGLVAPCDSCPAGRADVLWTGAGFAPFPADLHWIDGARDAVSSGGRTYVAGDVVAGQQESFLGELRGRGFVAVTARPGDDGAQAPVLALAASAERLWRDGPLWWDGEVWRDIAGVARGPQYSDSWRIAAMATTRVALLPLSDGRVVTGEVQPGHPGGDAYLFTPGAYETWLPIRDGVCAAAALPDGGLALGGAVSAGSGLPLGAVAILRGGTIDPLGGGVTTATGARGWVGALLARGATLFAGGSFAHAGDVAAANIAQWDGAAWQALGDGVHGDSARVEALLDFEGALIAGGNFTRAGDVPAANIARWNGHAWEAMGSGFDGPVYALAVYDGALIAGGDFTHAGAAVALGLARWSGGAWQAIDSGGGGVTDGVVRALAAWRGTLYVGGTFRTVRAAGVDAPSTYLARWSDSGRFVLDAPPRQAPRIHAITGLPTTRLSRVTYELPQAGTVRVALYDVAGREARVLAHGTQAAGTHTVEWRADDSALSPGVYRLVLDASGVRTARAVVILR